MQKGVGQLNFASLFPNRLVLARATLCPLAHLANIPLPVPPTLAPRTRSCYPSHSMIYNQRRSSCKQKRPRYLRFCPRPAANLRLLPGTSSLKIHRAVSLFQSQYAKTPGATGDEMLQSEKSERARAGAP